MAIEKILAAGLAIAAVIMFTSFVNGGGEDISNGASNFQSEAEKIAKLKLW